MHNLVLFALTVAGYGGIAGLIALANNNWQPVPSKILLKRYAIMALLCLPVNIGGNVYTVMGNAEAEKNLYSVASIYGKAGGDIITVVNILGYEKAGGNVIVIAGLPLYLEAGNDAILGIGFSSFEQAGKSALVVAGFAVYQQADNAGVLIGISLYQKATNGVALVMVGVSAYQEAMKSTIILLGISAYQYAHHNEAIVLIGLSLHQFAKSCEIDIGIIGFQGARKQAISRASIVGLQKVGDKTRSFAVWSDLNAKDQ